MPTQRLTAVRPTDFNRSTLPVVAARGAVVLALSVIALVAFAQPSSAHAVLESSNPVANSTVATSPQQITLQFSDAVKLSSQPPRLLDSEAVTVNTGIVTLTHHGSRLTIPTPPLRDGTYTVTWRVLSPDGHPIPGTLVFNVGAASSRNHVGHISGQATSRAVGIYTGVLRAIGFGAFTIAVGSLLFVAVCTPHLAGTRRAQMLTATALFVLGVAGIAQCFGLHPFTNGGSVGDIASFKHFRDSLELEHGKALVIRFVLALIGIVLFSRHRLRGRRFLGLAIVGLWVAALASTFAFIGHPRSGRWRALAILLDGVHLVAASTWVGGLVALIVLVLLDKRSTEHHAAAVKFGKIAAASVVVVAISGAIQSIRQMSAISDFWNETYGRLLGVKLIAVGLILLVAMRSRWLTKGESSDPKKLRTMVTIETIGVAIVISLTSLLVNSPPPQDIQSLRNRLPVVTAPKMAMAMTTANGVIFHTTVDPNTVGTTTLAITAESAPGVPAKLFELHATLQPAVNPNGIAPIDIALTGKNGRYTSKNLTIPTAGVWKLALRALTGPIDQFETSVTLNIG